MIRRDLLSLEEDDLAALSNRGNVNRARRELERGDLTYQMNVIGDDLQFTWSDPVTCTIFSEHPLTQARCTCPATRLCRHILRSVLAYKRDTEDAETIAEAWDPGELLAWSQDRFSTARRKRAAELESEGLVIELTRGLKPNAVFHGLGHSIKFLVPHDGRYTRCDCPEDAPCIHTLLAIRAFSRLDPELRVGLDETKETHDLETGTLEAAEEALADILDEGISHTPSEIMDRLESHEKKLRENGLLWPAEALNDIRQQHEYYHGHDARFSSERLVELVGEFTMRCDAIRSLEHHSIPALFVAGRLDLDRHTRLGSARLVGLGITTRIYTNSTRVQAMLVDITSGAIIVAAHHFTHEDHPPSFANLARRLVFRGRHLHDLGSGQLIIKAGRLSSTNELEIGRAGASRYTQKFEWETLPSPVWGDSFGEVIARLETLPPASLRPRSASEDFHVLPVASVEEAGFDGRTQSVKATLHDSFGTIANLVHPYLDANREGTERLLRAFESGDRLVLVSGRNRLGAHGLTITAAGCVFENSAAERYIVQPQADTLEDEGETRFSATSEAAAINPLSRLQQAIDRELGDACLLGAKHLQKRDRDRLLNLSKQAQELGLERIASALKRLARDAAPAHLLEGVLLARLYHELG